MKVEINSLCVYRQHSTDDLSNNSYSAHILHSKCSTNIGRKYYVQVHRLLHSTGIINTGRDQSPLST